MNIGEILVGILALLCFGYSAVIYGVHSGAGTFLLWAALGVFFVCCAAGIHFHVWAMMPVWLQRVLAAAVGFGIALFVAVEGCILSGFGAKGEDNLDYIIVLGAQVRENGPSSVLKNRLNAAYDYLMENESTLCIVSGGQGSNEPYAEAQGMYEYLVAKGISSERILVEDQSLNTVQNITNSSALFDKETARVGIVTSNFHVFRSVRIAKKLGIQNVCGIAARVWPRYFLPSNMLREFFGVVKDFLRGNI
ncbi:MAG: YdcF family protein [Lachnospiraceae bacterium]|nr:YdcF family protein [Lachnospiraceae bacterium]